MEIIVKMVSAGPNPNNPAYGRGLGASCHNRHTKLGNPAP
jgi:hypothetical protein